MDDITLKVFCVKFSEPSRFNSEDEYTPDDDSYFGVNVRLLIGLTSEACDRFDTFVCSPSWLADHYSKIYPGTNSPVVPSSRPGGAGSQAVMLSTLILMERWSRSDLQTVIERKCEDCSGPNWATAASRLSRFFGWEYLYKFDEYVDKHSGPGDFPQGWRIRP